MLMLVARGGGSPCSKFLRGSHGGSIGFVDSLSNLCHMYIRNCRSKTSISGSADNNDKANLNGAERGSPRPLEGFRVVECGHLIAGPFAGTMLAYFGAEVIKIEPPGKGDQLRDYRITDETGTSLWWYSLGRNKKSLCLDLNSEDGRQIVRDLCSNSDILIENFRPGRMERWNLGPEDIKKINPELIYTRISGFGQSGPYASLPGFASVCEAMGGFRYVNGFPDRPSVRPNLSLGDTLAGMHAVIGVTLALLARMSKKNGEENKTKDGQVVDVAIYESVFNVMEAVVPEYGYAGKVRGPSGSTLTGIVPSNTYPCADGKDVVIGANTDTLFKKLMHVAGRDDLRNTKRLDSNSKRMENQKEIDDAVRDWTMTLSSGAVLQHLREENIPVGMIYSVADMVTDEHFRERGVFEQVAVTGKQVLLPAILPKLQETPGKTTWAGPRLGEHTVDVLKNVLGKSNQTVEKLLRDGVVSAGGCEV